MVSHTGKFQSRIVLQRALELVKSHTFLICIFFEIVSYKGDYNLILCLLFFVFKLGVPISGFQVEAVGGVILNLLDDVSSWEPGDRIVVASTDYSMYQTEEFTLLPCPECTNHQVKVRGMRAVNT